MEKVIEKVLEPALFVSGAILIIVVFNNILQAVSQW